MKEILLIGDSLTEFGYRFDGWVAQLSNMFARRCDVVNRGLSGYSTRWVLNRFKYLPSRMEGADYEPPVLATLFFGANDAAETYQGIDVEEYRQNIVEIVRILKDELKIPRVVIIAPPPIVEAAWVQYLQLTRDPSITESNRIDTRTKLFSDAVLELCADGGALGGGRAVALDTRPSFTHDGSGLADDQANVRGDFYVD